MGFVGELCKVCSQMVLKWLYLARIGRPDILWSVDKLARADTKWTKACDKRLARLISDIHHTCEYQQYCYVGNTAKQCRLVLFHSKSTSGGILCIFGSRKFVPMCKKQILVPHGDWLFDRIILDSKIQIRYIDTKHQLADILTKGNFTRDEWNHLLSLFNISHFSSACCAKNSSVISCSRRWRKGCRSKKEKHELCQNRNLQRWTCLHMFRQVPQPRKFRLHLKARGYSQLRGNLNAGWEEIWNPTQRRVLKLFNETGRLIRNQTENIGVTMFDFKELTWRWTSFFVQQSLPDHKYQDLHFLRLGG